MAEGRPHLTGSQGLCKLLIDPSGPPHGIGARTERNRHEHTHGLAARRARGVGSRATQRTVGGLRHGAPPRPLLAGRLRRRVDRPAAQIAPGSRVAKEVVSSLDLTVVSGPWYRWGYRNLRVGKDCQCYARTRTAAWSGCSPTARGRKSPSTSSPSRYAISLP